MGNLYYNVLGNPFQGPGSTSIGNAGPFNNVQYLYWLGTEYTQTTELAYVYAMFQGAQGDPFFNIANSSLNAWAIHDGDVGEVPLPAAAWLFGSALLGLGAIRRKRA